MRTVVLGSCLLVLVAHTGFAAQLGVDRDPRVGKIAGGRCPQGEVAYAGREVIWCGGGRHSLAAPVVWSSRRDAVAFATRAPSGRVTLRVAVVDGVYEGTMISWPLHLVGRRYSVTWLARDRVAIGRSEFTPELVASWRLARR